MAILSFSGYQKAFAEDQAKASGKIQAIVDYDTSSVVIENGMIANTSADDGLLALRAVNVAAAKGVGECNWTLKIEDQQIYDDRANRKNSLQNVIIHKQEQLVSVATDMSFETAAALVGKAPVTIEYWVEKVFTISPMHMANAMNVHGGMIYLDIPKEGSQTICESTGNWFPWICAAYALFAVLSGLVLRLRQRGDF